ncbi:hypothetical protein [Streptomyces cacaoi]|uniref:Uncharacterized protein n=1 Tax=Streptomyces cacaoi TaxID=1898 RepID=A0A4Y3R195_STRCI|nr:hypothetical protein [Streptomyces cacaoi]GEB50458.1 hypothetical protein SCA03_30090 [Streptomyces cacaoi]
MSKILDWVKANPTGLYTALASIIPLIATVVSFDQDKVLGFIAAVITLVSGVTVRRANLKATQSAREMSGPM